MPLVTLRLLNRDVGVLWIYSGDFDLLGNRLVHNETISEPILTSGIAETLSISFDLGDNLEYYQEVPVNTNGRPGLTVPNRDVIQGNNFTIYSFNLENVFIRNRVFPGRVEVAGGVGVPGTGKVPGYKGWKCMWECMVKGVPHCAEQSEKGFVCTRHKGHSGPHVACANNGKNHEFDVWGSIEEDQGIPESLGMIVEE